MAPEPSARKPEDRVLEALIELARSAMRTDAEAQDRRAKLRVIEPRRRNAA